MAPQITDSQQIATTEQVLDDTPLPVLPKDVGFGAKVVRHADGERYLRLLANFSEQQSEIIVRPVEDKLYILDGAEHVLRMYDLPESVDPFTVEANIRADGLLVVVAKLKCAANCCDDIEEDYE